MVRWPAGESGLRRMSCGGLSEATGKQRQQSVARAVAQSPTRRRRSDTVQRYRRPRAQPESNSPHDSAVRRNKPPNSACSRQAARVYDERAAATDAGRQADPDTQSQATKMNKPSSVIDTALAVPSGTEVARPFLP